MAGSLVHFELPVRDVARAQAFYKSLFNWSYEPYGEDYQFISGSPSGGIFAGGEASGTPIVYFDVDDIDAAVGRVRELDGSAQDIQEMPGISRSVHCRDDQGAAFSVFHAAQSG